MYSPTVWFARSHIRTAIRHSEAPLDFVPLPQLRSPSPLPFVSSHLSCRRRAAPPFSLSIALSRSLSLPHLRLRPLLQGGCFARAPRRLPLLPSGALSSLPQRSVLTPHLPLFPFRFLCLSLSALSALSFSTAHRSASIHPRRFSFTASVPFSHPALTAIVFSPRPRDFLRFSAGRSRRWTRPATSARSASSTFTVSRGMRTTTKERRSETGKEKRQAKETQSSLALSFSLFLLSAPAPSRFAGSFAVRLSAL